MKLHFISLFLSLVFFSPCACSRVSDHNQTPNHLTKEPGTPRFKMKPALGSPASKEEPPVADESDMVFDGNINLRTDLSDKIKYKYARGVLLSVRKRPGPLNSDYKTKGKLFPIINGKLDIRGIKPLEYSCDFIDKDGNIITSMILDFSSIDPEAEHQANPEIIH